MKVILELISVIFKLQLLESPLNLVEDYFTLCHLVLTI